MRYSLIISDTIEMTALIAAIHAIDPSATVIADPQQSEAEKLCEVIRADAKFDTGFVHSNNINQIIERGLTVGLDVVDQIRINAADVYPSDSLSELLIKEDHEEHDRVIEAWSMHVHGNLLHEMGDILLLVLFGTKPDPTVIDAMRDCKVKCDHMNEDDQRALFTDYEQFVNDTLNRASVEYGINIDIDQGFDS